MSKDNRPVLRLTWSRQPNETGLARIGQSERGWILKVSGDKQRIASVSALTGPRRWETVGWYCVARHDGLGIPLLNTSATKQTTQEPAESMALSERHVLQHLSSAYRVSIRRPRGMGVAAKLEDAP